MGKCKDLSEFDKGQIVMARPLDQSISITAALVGCSRSAVVSIYQKYPLSPIFSFYQRIQRVGRKMRESGSEYKVSDEERSLKGASRNENCQNMNLSWGAKFLLAPFQTCLTMNK
ncbi:hypothetical protein QTP86_010539 [Hemibagrus guttatus]|nr:hypothetical protein QTP86_010539 [Hemibagrus guttatus]